MKFWRNAMIKISEQLPILIVIIPLFTALTGFLLGLIHRRLSWFISVIGLFFTALSSFYLLRQVINYGPQQYKLGNWMPPYGIEYVVDHLNAIVLLMIALVAFLVAIYSKASIEKELPTKMPGFYTLFTLFSAGLLGITITGDAFNVYVLLEIAALTGYGLLAIGGGKRAYLSTFNYLIMGSIGACFYLLGVGYIFIKTGTLNINDIQSLIPLMLESKAILAGFCFIIVGIFVKMAFFPLHGWLPNVYTYAPSAASALIAPLMTKVSVYALIRVMFFMFSANYVFTILKWSSVIIWLAVIAIIMGSLFALAQRNIKKMLSYLIVAEIGYMVGGIFIGNSLGLTGAIYHIIADGFMTAALFMIVGAIVYKTGSSDLSAMKGLFKKMPITMSAFCLAAFSMIGIPPTCGFVSKWYLISGAYQAGQWAFIIALILSSLMNAFLFFRIIETAFFEATPEETPDVHGSPKVSEAPVTMLVPIVVTSLILILLGLLTNSMISSVIQPIIIRIF